MEMGDPHQRISVAITGALGQPRAKVAEMINQTTNGIFVESITFTTHYLACTKHDSKKARKAARLGTTVISEAELMEYVAAGIFPSTALPTRPKYWGEHLPDILWTRKPTPELCLMTYCDARGNWTIRRVLWVSNGRSPGHNGSEWVGGYDGPQFKTWRADRVSEMEVFQGGTVECD